MNFTFKTIRKPRSAGLPIPDEMDIAPVANMSAALWTTMPPATVID